MELLFTQFIKERRYLRNLSETTLTYYQQVFTNLHNSGFTELTKESLTAVIIKMRERGVAVGGVNAYIRGINVFVRRISCLPANVRHPIYQEQRQPPRATKAARAYHPPANQSVCETCGRGSSRRTAPDIPTQPARVKLVRAYCPNKSWDHRSYEMAACISLSKYPMCLNLPL